MTPGVVQVFRREPFTDEELAAYQRRVRYRRRVDTQPLGAPMVMRRDHDEERQPTGPDR
jgi:hypothetical protein